MHTFTKKKMGVVKGNSGRYKTIKRAGDDGGDSRYRMVPLEI